MTVTVWQDREVMRVQPGYVEESYGAAVDIGSTTIALYLCDLATGEILAAEFGDESADRVWRGCHVAHPVYDLGVGRAGEVA